MALAGIRGHLRWRASPEGVLQTLRERLADAERDLPRARNATERTRIETDLADLKRQVLDQQQLVEHPKQVAQRVEESIARGIEHERKPARPVSGLTRFIRRRASRLSTSRIATSKRGSSAASSKRTRSG
jgi:hypothetical protein